MQVHLESSDVLFVPSGPSEVNIFEDGIVKMRNNKRGAAANMANDANLTAFCTLFQHFPPKSVKPRRSLLQW